LVSQAKLEIRESVTGSGLPRLPEWLLQSSVIDLSMSATLDGIASAWALEPCQARKFFEFMHGVALDS